MVKLLILEEKHHTRFFAYETDAELNRIALKILTERAATGHHYPELEELEKSFVAQERRLESNYSPTVRMAAEAWENFSGALAAADPAALEELTEEREEKRPRYLRELKSLRADRKQELLFPKKLAQLLSSENPEAEEVEFRSGRTELLGIYLLNARSDHQYEGFQLEVTEDY